jgi:hypothetical protein
MMTIRRLSIGAGYKYLLKSIAAGDGPEGPTGRTSFATTQRPALPRASFSGPASSVSTTVVALPSGSPSARRTSNGCSRTAPIRSPARCSEGLPSAKAVGGFDLTFSPSKSVSVAWALADKETRESHLPVPPGGHRRGPRLRRARGLSHSLGPAGLRRGGHRRSRSGELHPLRFARRRSPTPRPRGRAQPGPGHQ